MLGAYQDFLAVVAIYRDFSPTTAWSLRVNLLKASQEIQWLTNESNSYSVDSGKLKVGENAGKVISLLLAILVEEKQRIDINELSRQVSTETNSFEAAIDSFLDCPHSLEKAYDVIYYIKKLVNYHKIDFTDLMLERWEQDIKRWEQDIQQSK